MPSTGCQYMLGGQQVDGMSIILLECLGSVVIRDTMRVSSSTLLMETYSSVIQYQEYEGGIIFYEKGEGRLFVMSHHQFFLPPPLVPPYERKKNSGPPPI